MPGEPSRETSAATAGASHLVAATGADQGDATPAQMSLVPADATDVSRLEERRKCEWCRGDIPEGKRSDARTCSQPCRQAAHRFRIGVAPAATDGSCRFAYADPPYPGLAGYYRDQPTYGGEVDHAALVARLVREFPAGWALSTSAEALPMVLGLCPPGARVCPWVKGARAAKSRRALSAWEPVIVVGGRVRREAVAEDLCDVLLWGGRQPSHPGAVIGMKPAPFCEWMFRLLGARQGDELEDLFPGSGAVARAWSLYTRREGPADALPSCLAGATRRLLSLAAGGDE